MKPSLRITLPAILAIFVLFSCAGKRKPEVSASLEGKKWTLVSVEGKQAGQNVSYVEFGKDKNRVSGKGGCNGFGGTYKQTGQMIKIEGIISTKMACDHLDIENAFLKALETIDHYQIKQGELYLYKKDVVLAVLKAASL